MNAPARTRAQDGPLRRLAYQVLLVAVRGRRDRGGPWGEAVLGEFPMTRGGWEAIRWAAGGLRTVWRERRARLRQAPRYVRISRQIAATAVLGLIAAVVVNQFLLTVRFVPSASMEPTLRIDDRYVLERIGGIDRGDIVVFVRPGSDSGRIDVAKRVIGLPGDVIDCHDGRVFRNGTALDEPYLPDDPQQARTDCTPTTVPDGRLYVLGDRRDASADSREYGVIAAGDVRGHMLFRLWPIRH